MARSYGAHSDEYSRERRQLPAGVSAVRPVIDEKARVLCLRPYPGHPHGCPNWGKRPACPPAAPLFQDVLDLDGPVHAAYSTFDLAAHVARLRIRHPSWSERRLRCCLYWQGTARKRLRGIVEAFLSEHPTHITVYCPEACGVDVTATMAAIGIRLEWPPRRVAYQVALIGLPANGASFGGASSGLGAASRRRDGGRTEPSRWESTRRTRG